MFHFRPHFAWLTYSLSLSLALAGPPTSFAQETSATPSKFFERFKSIDLPAGIEFEAYERTEPRPLRIYRLVVDLSNTTLEPAIGIAPDPDGAGPAETALTSPKKLAQEQQMVVAINTNAWSMIPDPDTGKSIGYVAGGHADIHGWVADGTATKSPVQAGYWTLWIDAKRTPHLQNLTPKEAKALEAPLIAIAGFRGILTSHQILVEPSEILHPRTAIGFDESKKRLVLIVVDGRQPKVSEGVSEEELARLMLEFGCSDAMNLDGGGSSVMLVREQDGNLRFINRSSDITGVRPVPVIFGFRLASPTK